MLMTTRNFIKTISISLFSALLLVGFSSKADAQQVYNDYSALYDSETVSALRSHIRYISSSGMEGRKPGSEGETLTAEYIAEKFEEYGLDLLLGKEGDLFGLKAEEGDTLRSRNIIGIVPGYDKNLRNQYIVVGARMDNLGNMRMNIDGESQNRIFYGANGNASGVAMMLELAKKLKTNQILLKRSVMFVGFGGSSVMNAGSWYFLNRSFKDLKIDAMINLDALGTGESGFYAYTSSNADLNALVGTLAGELQPIKPTITAKEPFQSDHRSFYEKQIPSIFFTTGEYSERNTERDTESIINYGMMERELEYIYNYSVTLANAPSPVFNPSEELKKRHSSGDNVVPYYDCDVRPSFLGTSDTRVFLQKWVYQYLKYPEACVKNGIQGRVLVDFIINEQGKVTDVKVLKGVDELLDAEAVRVISASPDWKPGKVKGQKVKSEMSLYVEFRLEKKGSKKK